LVRVGTDWNYFSPDNWIVADLFRLNQGDRILLVFDTPMMVQKLQPFHPPIKTYQLAYHVYFNPPYSEFNDRMSPVRWRSNMMLTDLLNHPYMTCTLVMI